MEAPLVNKTRADTALTHGPPNPTSPELRYHPREMGGPMTMALPYRQKAMVKTKEVGPQERHTSKVLIKRERPPLPMLSLSVLPTERESTEKPPL